MNAIDACVEMTGKGGKKQSTWGSWDSVELGGKGFQGDGSFCLMVWRQRMFYVEE